MGMESLRVELALNLAGIEYAAALCLRRDQQSWYKSGDSGESD
jgi:hypothetical protein